MPAQFDRREFLKTAIATTSLLGAGINAQSAAIPEPKAETSGSAAALDQTETDVLVVGAGASGIPAAVAAARSGARVLLLEEDQTVGGAPVDMFVTFLCGGPRLGIHREMVRQLNDRHDLSGKPLNNFNDGNDGLDHWYLPSAYTRVLMALIRNEKSLTLVTGARVLRCLVTDAGNRHRVRGVVYEGPGGEHRAISARTVIDATGTGAIAASTGCEVMYGRESKADFNEVFGMDKADTKVMPCTWMFISQRIRPNARLDVERLRIKGLNESGLGWYALQKEEFLKRNTGIYLHWGSTVLCEDTRDPEALGAAQCEALDRAEEDIAIMEECGYAVHLAPKIGMRECRRIVGEHVITLNDLKSDKMPEDVVATGIYPLDIWGQNEKLTTEQKHLPPYGIPYRALIPKGVDGMLVAGKAISGTHIAMGAYRVQPIVASIGQAAGVAAAMAAQNNTSVRDVEIKHLQKSLKKMGVLS